MPISAGAAGAEQAPIGALVHPKKRKNDDLVQPLAPAPIMICTGAEYIDTTHWRMEPVHLLLLEKQSLIFSHVSIALVTINTRYTEYFRRINCIRIPRLKIA